MIKKLNEENIRLKYHEYMDDEEGFNSFSSSRPRSNTNAFIFKHISPRRTEMMNNLEQGNQNQNAKSFEVFLRKKSYSRLGTIATRIEELKNSPSLEGCNKDHIIAIIALTILLVSHIQYNPG